MLLNLQQDVFRLENSTNFGVDIDVTFETMMSEYDWRFCFVFNGVVGEQHLRIFIKSTVSRVGEKTIPISYSIVK